MVTLLDPDSMSKEYMSRIKENRIDYADRYGSCEKDFSILSQSIKKKEKKNGLQEIVLSQERGVLTLLLAFHYRLRNFFPYC